LGSIRSRKICQIYQPILDSKIYDNKMEIDGVLSDDHDITPMEKWLVAFRNRNSRQTTGSIHIREFQCGGYYDALERVQGYAEKTDNEVLWFKEKRDCDESLAYSIQLPLGCFCTYCNVEHNTEDSIPCQEQHCSSILCSRKCYEHHVRLKHMKSGTLSKFVFKLC
jgi:hypothetical protein